MKKLHVNKINYLIFCKWFCLDELLSINDEFNATFEKYERCMANFNANGIDLTMVESGSKININEEKLKESGGGGSDLIDFGENNGKGKNEKIGFFKFKEFFKIFYLKILILERILSLTKIKSKKFLNKLLN